MSCSDLSFSYLGREADAEVAIVEDEEVDNEEILNFPEGEVQSVTFVPAAYTADLQSQPFTIKIPHCS